MSDILRLRGAENARRQLYDQCEDVLHRETITEEIRHEISAIRERTGKLNPVIQGPSRVQKEVTLDRERLEQLLNRKG